MATRALLYGTTPGGLGFEKPRKRLSRMVSETSPRTVPTPKKLPLAGPFHAFGCARMTTLFGGRPAPRHRSAWGMGEPHPPRRFVLLARCRPSQQRFRSRECRCGIPGIERVVSSQRATTPWSLPPTSETLAATIPPDASTRRLPGGNFGEGVARGLSGPGIHQDGGPQPLRRLNFSMRSPKRARPSPWRRRYSW